MSSFVKFSATVTEENFENVSANQIPGWSTCFSDRPKITNLVEDIEILFFVKFCWIAFSSVRGGVQNVSANQWPGSHLVFGSARKTQTW